MVVGELQLVVSWKPTNSATKKTTRGGFLKCESPGRPCWNLQIYLHLLYLLHLFDLKPLVDNVLTHLACWVSGKTLVQCRAGKTLTQLCLPLLTLDKIFYSAFLDCCDRSFVLHYIFLVFNKMTDDWDTARSGCTGDLRGCQGHPGSLHSHA